MYLDLRILTRLQESPCRPGRATGIGAVPRHGAPGSRARPNPAVAFLVEWASIWRAWPLPWPPVITQLTLENYRCFQHRQQVRLAPLTLLVGENSTGKTSFLAMLRVLSHAIRDKVPNFREDPYDLGSFEDIAFHRTGKVDGTTTFKAGFVISAKADSRAALHLDITFGKIGVAPVPVRMRYTRSNVWVEWEMVSGKNEYVCRFGTTNGAWQSPMHGDDMPFRMLEDVGLSVQIPSFERLLFFITLIYSEAPGFSRKWQKIREGTSEANDHAADAPGSDDMKAFKKISRAIRQQYQSPEFSYASGPVRSQPRRVYDPVISGPDPQGAYIPVLLAHTYFSNEEQWNGIKGKLEKFGSDAGLFNEIQVERLGAGGDFRLLVKKYSKWRKGPKRNLLDVGYGVSQILPIVTELLRQDKPSVLLQQPEVHLHPCAQAALGSLFGSLAKQGAQLIVETHSDYLLDRIRMDVRDGKTIKPRDVSILYFEPGNLDVTIHTLGLDKSGNITNAPPGYANFFMAETERLLGIKPCV